MKCSIFISLLILSPFLETAIVAYPSGAGGCATSMAAVADTHLTNAPVTTGKLIDGNFQVASNGNVVLNPNLNVTAVTLGGIYQINILPVSGSGAVFRGVLIRVEGPGSFTLVPKLNAQIATACPGNGIVGVTHLDATDKSEFSSEFRTESEGNYKIEVTVVVANSATSGSTYYYESFEFTSFQEIPEFPTVTPEFTNSTLSPVAPTAPTVAVPAPVGVPAPSAVSGNMTIVPTPAVANGTNVTMPPTMGPSVTVSPSTTKTPSGTVQPSTVTSDTPTDFTNTLMPTKGIGGTTRAPVMESAPTPLAVPVKPPTTDAVPTSGSINVMYFVQVVSTIFGAMLIVSLPIAM